MNAGEGVPFREALGIGVRRAREANGVTQDNVAIAATLLGLGWDRSKVAAIERGERPISAEDLILLPFVMDLAGAKATLAEMLEPLEQEIDLGRTIPTMSAGAILTLLGGKPRPKMQTPLASVQVRSKTRRAQIDEDHALKRAIALGAGEVSYDAFRQAEVTAGEAEQKVAKRLEEPKLTILAIAVSLWGRSLTAERDARVQQLIEHTAGHRDRPPDARTVQAARGHVTRQLTEEIRDLIFKAELYPDQLPHAKKKND